MIENILAKLGLSAKEISVYLACLKLGPSPVRKIAEAAEINRGTTYDILKSLREFGLVSYYHQAKNQYFMAEDPAKLKNFLDHKLQQLQNVETEVENIIPQLKSMYDNADTKPVVKMYDGNAGLKIILQDVLSSFDEIAAKEYYVYSSSTIKNFLYKAYPKFSADRIKEKIKVKVISIGPGGEERGLDERKWLTKKEGAPTYTLIYAGKVAMISLDSNNKPIGVIIADRNLYQTQKIIFDGMWSVLKTDSNLV